MIGNQIIGPTRCSDGWASPSIGKQGACSHHGGVNRSPRNGVLILSILGGFLAAAFIGSSQSNKSGQIGREDKALSRRGNKVQNQSSSSPQCPICGSGMVLRVARKGIYAGNQFYGCEKYPRCKGLINKNDN